MCLSERKNMHSAHSQLALLERAKDFYDLEELLLSQHTMTSCKNAKVIGIFHTTCVEVQHKKKVKAYDLITKHSFSSNMKEPNSALAQSIEKHYVKGSAGE